MNTLTDTDRSTVSKHLGLIGSHHDAEALTAARKAHELIKAKGATWPEILGIEADDTPPAAEPDHVTMAQDLLHRGKSIITRWERDFLIGVMGFKTPKPKQLEILYALSAKINVAGSDL